MSQWNKFRYIKCGDLDYGFDIKVVTQTLTLKDLSNSQIERLELIERMYSQGLNSVQISSTLNEMGVLTPTGLQYNPTLIWVSHNKYQKRKIRMKDTRVSVHGDYFFVKKF